MTFGHRYVIELCQSFNKSRHQRHLSLKYTKFQETFPGFFNKHELRGEFQPIPCISRKIHTCILNFEQSKNFSNSNWIEFEVLRWLSLLELKLKLCNNFLTNKRCRKAPPAFGNLQHSKK